MATYRNPKYTPLQEAGVEPVKTYLRRTPMSIANTRSDEYPQVKTEGVVTRGNGAATKGTKARGPMA